MFGIVRRLRGIVAGVVAAGLACVASAAPFSTSYHGTIYASNFPQIINGQAFKVTLVVDNGGATAASQSWTKANLKCVIFRMNNAGDVAFAQDLAATNAELTVVGSIATDAGGALTGFFSKVLDQAGPAPGTYSVAGFSPPPPIYWFLNSVNYVFFGNASAAPAEQFQFGDPSGGVHMGFGYWSAPVPFDGACSAPAAVRESAAPGIPTLSELALALLALTLAAGAVPFLRASRRRA